MNLKMFDIYAGTLLTTGTATGLHEETFDKKHLMACLFVPGCFK
jgi:hypothetical protein